MSEVISPVSIDLGAKQTGVYFTHYPAGEDPVNHIDNSQGHVIQYNEANLTISQEKRRIARHQRRGYKRRKMVKGLFYAFLKSRGVNFGDLDYKLKDFINGLFNRRGFTYLCEDLDEELIHNLSPKIVNDLCEDEILRSEPILDQIRNWASELETVHKFIGAKCFATKKEFEKNKKKYRKERIKKIIDEDHDVELINKSLENLRDYGIDLIKQKEEGHKPRKEYFKNITEDIANCKDLKPYLKKLSLKAVQLSHLIGHISNFQLRMLRKYFNDENMKGGYFFDEKRLKHFFRKWLIALKPNKVSENTIYENRKKILELLAQNKKGLLDILLNQNPEMTIPPYENQNNRRPPLCQSLILNANTMQKELASWVEITNKIIENDDLPDFKKIPADIPNYISDENKKALVLQRILDKSKAIDSYNLVSICRDEVKNAKESKKVERKSIKIKDILSKKDMLAFIEFAERYYRERASARRGAWIEGEKDNLLSLCNYKPKLKKNSIRENVNSILAHNFSSEEKLDDFKDFWKSKKISGRSTLLSVCKQAETIRKKHGNYFAAILKEIEKGEYDKNDKGKPKDKDVLEIVNFQEKSKIAIESIATYLDTEKSRFDNLFSLAQIYNVMEGELHGFYKTCVRCTVENGLRTSPSMYNKSISNASRLPAYSIRPFNGTIRRLLEAKAANLAHHKLNHLEKMQIDHRNKLSIPIIIEQNKFSFTADMADINRSRQRKKADEKNDSYQKKLENNLKHKNKRIKEASQGICPYTGRSITNGEIDHIIPRSQTKELYGTIFNSEANLIFCSVAGNRNKGSKIYYLDKLHKNYLKKQFGNYKISDIEAKIKEDICQIEDKLNDNRKVFEFSRLSKNEQISLRHALFVNAPDVRNKAFKLLNTAYKSKVNGTQAYFIDCFYKQLKKGMEKKYKNNPIEWSIKKIAVDYTDVHSYRNFLEGSCYQKDKNQSSGSHVIDACLAFAFALGDAKNQEILKAPSLMQGDKIETSEWLKKLQTERLQLHELERRSAYRKKQKDIASLSLFNAGIFGERFIPMLLIDGKLYAGFEKKNCAPIIEKEEQHFFELLQAYLLHNAKPISNNLASLKELEKKEGCLLHFSIHKKKALDLLHKASKEKLDDKDYERAQVLQGLRYTVQKKEVIEYLSDKPKKNPTEDKKQHCLTVEIKLKINGKKLSYIDKKSLVYPEKLRWEALFKLARKKKVLGKNSNDEELIKVIREFFKSTTTDSQLKHNKVRKNFSLNTISNPSGGVRLRRKLNSINNDPSGYLYQLMSPETNLYSGFELETGSTKPILKKDNTIPLVAFASSKNVSFVKNIERVVPKKDSEICFFDEWFQTQVPTELKDSFTNLWFSPNTSSRMKICVEMKFEIFLSEIYKYTNSYVKERANKKEANSALIYTLHGDCMLKDKAKKFLRQRLNVEPRRNTKIKIKALDKELISFCFVVENNTAKAIELLKSGERVKPPF